MRVSSKPEYKALVNAIQLANKGFDQEQAENLLENIMIDIEEGELSYFEGAIKLGLRANLVGQCGFDAADYLSYIC